MHHLTDSPIVSPEADLYRMSPFARRLARLLRTAPAEGGMVVGLAGPAGSGKASTVNMALGYMIAMDIAGLDRAVADETAEDDALSAMLRGMTLPLRQEQLAALETASGGPGRTLVLRYDAWASTGQPGLIADIFRQLGTRIAAFARSEDGDAVAQAARALAALLDPRSERLAVPPPPRRGLFGRAPPAPQPPSSLDEARQALRRALDDLKAVNARILVVLENVARLAPAEAQALLSMVNTLGRLPGISYLLSYDPVALTALLERAGPGLGQALIEKTVTTPLDLPRPAPMRLLEALVSLAEDCFEAPMTEGEHDDLVRGFRTIPPLLDGPRDVTRLANALAFTDAATGRCLRTTDLIRMEMLRLAEPPFYDWMMTNAVQFHPRSGLFQIGDQKTARNFLESGLSRVEERNQLGVAALLAATFEGVARTLSLSGTSAPERLHDFDIRYPLDGPDGWDVYLRSLPATGVLSPEEWQHASDVRGDLKRSRAFVDTLIARQRDDGKPLLFTFLGAITRLPTAGGEPHGLLAALLELPDDIVAEGYAGTHRSALRELVHLLDYFEDPAGALSALILKEDINPFALAVLLEVLAERNGLMKSARLRSGSPLADAPLIEAIATLYLRISSVPPERTASWFATVELFPLLSIGTDKAGLYQLAQMLLTRDNDALRYFLYDVCTPWPFEGEIVHQLTHRPDPQLYPLEAMRDYAARAARRLPGDRFLADFTAAAGEFLADAHLKDRSARIRAKLGA